MRTVKSLTSGEKKSVDTLLGTGAGFISGMVHANFDEERLSGLAITHKSDAGAQSNLVEKDAFQFIGIVHVDTQIANPHVTGDSYFTERKAALDRVVPQYASKAPPSLVYRSRKDNRDTEITGVELGQYGGRVGVYKQTEEGKDGASYYLVAVGGAQKANEELKMFVGEQMEAVENWNNPLTNGRLLRTPEFAYTADVAKCNVKRMLYAAADAFEVRIPETEYVNVDINPSTCSYPPMSIPDTIQPINTIEKHAKDEDGMTVYREVIPSSAIRGPENPLYVLQGPADAIYQFHPGRSHYHQGFPATTGRRVPLPKNVAAIPSVPKEHQLQYNKRLERVFYEGANVHPDVVPGTYRYVKTKTDRSFLDSLVKLGWDEKQHYDRLEPVCTKISNPYILRPVAAAVAATAKSSVVSTKIIDKFDEE